MDVSMTRGGPMCCAEVAGAHSPRAVARPRCERSLVVCRTIVSCRSSVSAPASAERHDPDAALYLLGLRLATPLH